MRKIRTYIAHIEGGAGASYWQKTYVVLAYSKKQLAAAGMNMRLKWDVIDVSATPKNQHTKMFDVTNVSY